MFSRDPSYAMQALMFLAACVFYLASARFLASSQISLPGVSPVWWRVFILLFNAAVEAFLVTALCLRFVYPAISLEGDSVWVLQAAPIEIKKVLHAKFRVWFFPLAFAASAVFGLSAFYVGVPWPALILKVIATWIVCLGMVGLALGMGCRFANFAWEHTAQLAAGVGNLIFMALSTGLIMLDLVLIWVPIFVAFSKHFALLPLMVIFAASFLALMYLNLFLCRWSLSWGERWIVRKLCG